MPSTSKHKDSAGEFSGLERRDNQFPDRWRKPFELPGTFPFGRLETGRGLNSTNSVPCRAGRMISHMCGCHRMTCGARRFTGGDIGGIACGCVRSESCCASGANADLASGPCARHLNRISGPVIEGMVLFEQPEHLFCTVGGPDGKLPMPVEIERTASMDGFEAIVSHGNSLKRLL